MIKTLNYLGLFRNLNVIYISMQKYVFFYCLQVIKSEMDQLIVDLD